MKDVSTQGRTILFVSHNLTAVRSLCDSGLLLSQGSIAKSGPIDSVIEHYLGDPQGDVRATYTFEVNNKKEAQILEIGFLNSNGNPVSEVDLTKTFSIRVKYALNQSMSGLIAGLSISRAAESESLIVSNEAELDIERIQSRKRGIYTNTITVPEKLLNSGRYRIKVGLTAHKNIYDVVDDIFVEVTDSVGIVQSLGFERKNSVLSTQLPWKYTHIEYFDEKRV